MTRPQAAEIVEELRKLRAFTPSWDIGAYISREETIAIVRRVCRRISRRRGRGKKRAMRTK
jgi:hypothetical protein